LIGLEGYQDCNGGDEIVLLEMRGSVPHVVIWGDVNVEDPTHIISLEAARNDNIDRADDELEPEQKLG